MAEQGINPKELIQLFLEKWPIIVIAVAISAAVSFKQSQNITSVFQAKATLQVDYNNTSLLSDIEQVNTTDLSDYDILNTIVETIANTELMRQVILDHDLLNNPEFAGEDAGSASLDRLARRLVGKVSTKLREETRLIDISLKDGNEELAIKLINWIAKGYIKQHATRRLDNNRFATGVLTNEAEMLKLKLRNAEMALIEFRRSSKLVVSLQERQGLVQVRINDLNTKLDTVRSSVSRIESDLALIKEFGEDASIEQLQRIPSIISTVNAEEYLTALGDQESTVANLALRYKERHPTRMAEQRKLDELRNTLRAALKKAPVSLDAEYRRLLLEKKTLETQVEAAEEESLALSSNAVEYNVLEREVATTTSLFDAVMTRIKEIDLTTGLQDQVISVIEEATRATDITPNGQSKLLMGIVFGMALGMGAIYLLHMLDTTIKSVDHAEQSLELPALGAIPGSEPKNRQAKSRLILISDPSSSCAEAFRSLRANVESLSAQEKRITLFTSSMPAEGKTFVCINYALTLAQRGLKTIIIDLDLRHPSVGGEFKFEDTKLRVADIIEDPRSTNLFVDENLQNPAKNLYVMPVGAQLANPAEILAGEAVTKLIRLAAEKFDRVIIDTAPMNPIGDTLAIVQMVDVICMVVRCRKTPTRIIQRSLETLRRFNSPAAGVVLNFVPAKKSMGNYYYYYGGKSPYQGARHYHTPTENSTEGGQPKSRGSDTMKSSSENAEDQNQPAPRHRRRRMRRPQPVSEISGEETPVTAESTSTHD